MKKTFVALVALLLLPAILAEVAVTNATEGTDTEVEIRAKAIDARYEIVTYGYNKTLAAMDAVIAYLTEKGVDVANLTKIRDRFVAAYANLGVYVATTNVSGFGAQVAEMHAIAAEFKHTTAQLVPPGQLAAARERMMAKAREKEAEAGMVEAAARAKAKRIGAHLAACEINVKRMEGLIARARAQNVTALKLGEIVRAARAECAALNATRDVARIRRIANATAEAHREAVNVVRELNERGVARAIAVISALERKGVNVSAVAQKLQVVARAHDAVRAACANASAPECATAMDEIKQNLSTIGAQIKVIARETRERAKIRVETGRTEEIEETEKRTEERARARRR